MKSKKTANWPVTKPINLPFVISPYREDIHARNINVPVRIRHLKVFPTQPQLSRLLTLHCLVRENGIDTLQE